MNIPKNLPPLSSSRTTTAPSHKTKADAVKAVAQAKLRASSAKAPKPITAHEVVNHSPSTQSLSSRKITTMMRRPG